MAIEEKQVYTPGSIGRCAGIWQRNMPHKLASGVLCEQHTLIGTDEAKTVRGRVYVYRPRARAAPSRVRYCSGADNFTMHAIMPPNVLAARYRVEQYAINCKIGEMRAAAAAAAEAAKNGGARQQQDKPELSKLQRIMPFIGVGMLTEVLIILLAYVAHGTN